MASVLRDMQPFSHTDIEHIERACNRGRRQYEKRASRQATNDARIQSRVYMYLFCWLTILSVLMLEVEWV